MNSRTAVAIPSLSEMWHAIETEHRMTDVEAILPTLVTKAEFNKAIGEIRTDNERFRADVNKAIGDIRTDNEKFRADVNKAIADMRVDFEKGQKDNRVWMLGTVIGLVAGFGAVFYSVQSSTAQNIDRMDRRIERMDERIERMDERIEQFREFMQSQRVQPVIEISPQVIEPNPASAPDSSE